MILNRIDLYVPLIYLLAAVPYAWLGLYTWRKRPAVAVTPFAWTMLGLSIWSFLYSLEIFLPTLAAKLFFVSIEYISIVSIPVFLLFFALEYTGKSHLLTLRVRLLTWIMPLLTLLLVWTNSYHRLMWDMEIVTEVLSLKLLEVRFGAFFWVHVVFSYGLLMIASLLLIMELIQRPGIYRFQISLVVLGILISLSGNFIFISGVNPVKNLDLTPLIFLPMALGFSWAITKYRLLEVMPLEHLTVLKNMKAGVIVLDPYQRIRYINPIMEGLINRAENDIIGQPLAHGSKIFGEKLTPYLSGGEHRAEIMIGQGKQAKVYDVTVSPVATPNASQNPAGLNNMVVLHDITERKEAEKTLSLRESILSAINLAAEQFLKEPMWEHNIPGVLEKIGQAADVSRVFVSMNYTDENRNTYSSLCYEWAAPSVSSQINNPALQHVPLRQSGLSRWEKTLSQRRTIHGMVKDFPEEEQKNFQGLDSLSIAAMPIFADSQWWGFIMFDECRHEREWTHTELEMLRITANIFGAAETRARTEQKSIRRQRALNLLHKIVTTSLQADNVYNMAQIVVEQLGELINADGCFMTLWDEAGSLAIPLAAYGSFKDSYTSLTPQPGEHTFTESALKLGHTLVIEDISATAYAAERIIKNFPSRSALALPLIALEKKLGCIILSFDRPHRFQPEEISISEQASALIALALEKFQLVEKAQRRANVSEALRKAGAAVAETLQTDQTVARILEQLHQVVSYDSASVQLLIDNELEIVGGRGWDNLSDVIGIRFAIPNDNPNSVVIETGKPYRSHEISEVYKKFNDSPHNHIRSWLGVPLMFQKKIIGLLAIDSAKPHHFTDDDINAASEFANQVAVALENARIHEEAQNQAVTDPLTGLYNRRGLFQLGEFEFLRARRIGRPFCALIFDIDNFKRTNDHYGHATGDQVLHKLAERCQKKSRAIDLVGRYGGEEFVLLLPETNLEAARLVAERLRLSIMNESFPTDVGALRITISVGVAEASDMDTLRSLIERADTALYKAKRAGRNRVMLNETHQPLDQT